MPLFRPTSPTDRRRLFFYYERMNGQEIIAKLRENEPALRARGVSRPDIDLDIMVKLDPAAHERKRSAGGK